jgi:hypothetical protein
MGQYGLFILYLENKVKLQEESIDWQVAPLQQQQPSFIPLSGVDYMDQITP